MHFPKFEDGNMQRMCEACQFGKQVRFPCLRITIRSRCMGTNKGGIYWW